MIANKGDWVQIHKVVLSPDERASQVPDDTKKVPLEQWVKGFALNESKIGEELEIETTTKRKIKGTLVAINPTYTHAYGNYIPELGEISKSLKEILFES